MGYVDGMPGEVGEVVLPLMETAMPSGFQNDFPDRLEKINLHAKKLTECKLPASCRYANGYEPLVDRNHMVSVKHDKSKMHRAD